MKMEFGDHKRVNKDTEQATNAFRNALEFEQGNIWLQRVLRELSSAHLEMAMNTRNTMASNNGELELPKKEWQDAQHPLDSKMEVECETPEMERISEYCLCGTERT
jgi:hypothetical protein